MAKRIYLDEMENSYFDDGLNGVIKYDDSDRAYFDDVDQAAWWQEYFNAVAYLNGLTDDDGSSYINGASDYLQEYRDYINGASDYLQDYQDYITIADDIKAHGESREVLAKYNDNVKAE